ncbi:universal stress protein [Nonomuraea guangzhouensis]|uniref:universal stress protein n=1 Tax=Nonomuraea guangzhouensis TaxID=1291555 RepID=UPI003FD8636C
MGYDGSDFSMQALDWALDECELRELPLTVTHAWRWPYGEVAEEVKLHLRKAAEHVLYHGAECARSSSTLADVEEDLYEGSPAERIVELSAGADLVVVGSRGLGALARSVVGSVTAYVAAHARAPVVIVRGPGPLPVASRPGPVVLGLSPTTPDTALQFAFDEAALRQLRLVAVHAVHLHAMAWGVAMPPVPDVEALTKAGQKRMEDRLAPWRDRHAEVRVAARAVFAPGQRGPARRVGTGEPPHCRRGTNQAPRSSGHGGQGDGRARRLPGRRRPWLRRPTIGGEGRSWGGRPAARPSGLPIAAPWKDWTSGPQSDSRATAQMGGRRG